LEHMLKKRHIELHNDSLCNTTETYNTVCGETRHDQLRQQKLHFINNVKGFYVS